MLLIQYYVGETQEVAIVTFFIEYFLQLASMILARGMPFRTQWLSLSMQLCPASPPTRLTNQQLKTSNTWPNLVHLIRWRSCVFNINQVIQSTIKSSVQTPQISYSSIQLQGNYYRHGLTFTIEWAESLPYMSIVHVWLNLHCDGLTVNNLHYLSWYMVEVAYKKQK